MAMTTIVIYRDKNLNVLVLSNSEYPFVGDSKFDKSSAILITRYETDYNPFRSMLQMYKLFKDISEYQKKYPLGLRLIK